VLGGVRAVCFAVSPVRYTTEDTGEDTTEDTGRYTVFGGEGGWRFYPMKLEQDVRRAAWRVPATSAHLQVAALFARQRTPERGYR